MKETEFRFFNLHPGRKWKPQDVGAIDGIIRSIIPVNELSSMKQTTTVKSYPVINPRDGRVDRKSTIRCVRDENTGVEKWEKKYLIKRVDQPNLFCQLVESSEEPFIPTQLPTTEANVRRRDRYSYHGRGFVFDITIVNGELEIELEFQLSVEEATVIAQQFVSLLFPLSQGVVAVNELLTYKYVPYTTTEARAFGKNDFTAKTFFDKTSYFVSPKADGERCYLYGDNLGLCLVTMSWYLSYDAMLHDKILIEGEWMKDIFYAYDIIYSNGLYHRDEDYEERRRILEAMSLDLPFPFVVKEAYHIDCVSNFFRFVEMCTTPKAYKTDGVIFTPNTTYYPTHENSLVQMLPVSKREGSSIPDIMKWKPRVTLDLLYLSGKLYVKGYSGNELFAPRESYTLHPSSYQNGAVYEFELEGGSLLRPLEIRNDKSYGNKKDVAFSNWNNMIDPFTLDMLLGKDIYLLRRHHNDIKRSIFFYHLAPGDILDIGSGRGGDLKKYPTNVHVLAVEPDAVNIAEAKKRYEEMRISYDSLLRRGISPGDLPNVTYLQTGGENYTTISRMLHAPVMNVTMMLSASFFWSSTQMLRDFAQTVNRSLRPGGRLILFTINGECLRTVRHYKDLGVEMRVDPWVKGKSQRVEIEFPGETIVGKKQIEYCVHPQDLLQYLGEDYRMLPNPALFYREPFLSPAQRKLNYLYSVHIFERLDDVLPPSSNEAKDMPHMPSNMCQGLYHYFDRSAWVCKMNSAFFQPRDAALERSVSEGKIYQVPADLPPLFKGLCYFLHTGDTLTRAILTSCMSGFANENERGKEALIEAVRLYLQREITKEYEHQLSTPGATLPLWCFISRGFFAENLLLTTKKNTKDTSSLSVIQSALARKEFHLNEAYVQLLASEFKVNVYLFEVVKEKLRLRSVTKGKQPNSILLLKNKDETREIYTTLCTRDKIIFPDNDPLIQRLQELHQDTLWYQEPSTRDVALKFVSLYRKTYGGYDATNHPSVDPTMQRYLDLCAPVING
jgi:SAM-dependent methyltransferase